MVDTLHADYSVRRICATLSFNRSNLYYLPKSDLFEQSQRDEIEKLAASYPNCDYRGITKLLLGMGYAVGYRRVARLMKADNLSVTVNRACQSTESLDGCSQWVDWLENLDICQCNQVCVGDITYVRLKEQFAYVSVLMDLFTRIVRE